VEKIIFGFGDLMLGRGERRMELGLWTAHYESAVRVDICKRTSHFRGRQVKFYTPFSLSVRQTSHSLDTSSRCSRRFALIAAEF